MQFKLLKSYIIFHSSDNDVKKSTYELDNEEIYNTFYTVYYFVFIIEEEITLFSIY